MAAQTTDETDSTTYGHVVESDDDSILTAQAFDSFPVGGDCDITIDDLPDEETEYGWSHHYERDSRVRSNPAVTDEIIAELLATGAVSETDHEEHDDRYLIQKEINGYRWTIVVADDGATDRERWVLITVYSHYHGSIGTTNHYYDRLQQRRSGDDA